MAKYTIELGQIVTSEAGELPPLPFSKINNAIKKAAPKVFNFEYPFYSDNQTIKENFQIEFLRKFYTDEIGAETYGRWKLYLQSKLCEIMPKYKQVYAAISESYNPYDLVNITKTGTTKNNKIQNNKNTSNKKVDNDSTNNQKDITTNDHIDRYSETPQGSIAPLQSENYLTEAHEIKDNSTQNIENKLISTNTETRNDTAENNANENGEYSETTRGKEGGLTYGEIKTKEIEAAISINAMIFDDLECLFMGVF